MARRQRRFSKLFETLRSLKGTSPDPEKAAEIANFKQYLDGNRKITIKPIDPKKYELREASIAPFNLQLAAAGAITNAERYVVTFTEMSNAGLSSVGVTRTDLGMEPTHEDNVFSSNFYPALIRVFIPSGSGQTSTSAITGKSYKRRNGTSYTYPFGRTTLQSAEQEARAALTIDIKGARPENAKATVSYEPEIFRSNRRRGTSI
ncbi:MAG: hypothetical protein HC925_00005 [Coleofasciculaceae cyanobacterium SM2_3_26]|nr:hypothetical protein [Coleofasciculaceae cyanobacterium SM2_3_26]